MGNNPGEAALGVALVLRKLRSMVPKARILLLGVFPTRKSDDQPRIRAVNDYLDRVGLPSRAPPIASSRLDRKLKFGLGRRKLLAGHLPRRTRQVPALNL